MASLCVDVFTSGWQEEAETEFTTKTLDLEALYGPQTHHVFQRSRRLARQPMARPAAAAAAAAAGNKTPAWSRQEVPGRLTSCL